MDIFKLIEDLINAYGCLKSARLGGAGESVRDLGNHIARLNGSLLENVSCLDDVKTNHTALELIDLEFKTIQPDIEKTLVAEAKRLYGAANASAQEFRVSTLGALDDVVLQEKTLRDLLKMGIPPWAVRSITNTVTGAHYTLEETEHIRQLLSSNNRL